MIYLLDTTAISDLVRAGTAIRAWLTAMPESDRVVTCPIVRGEVLFGIAKLAEGERRADLQEKTNRLLASLPCESVPEGAGDFYSAVKLARQRRGLSLDENDLWIAATALSLGATLVSRDTDFAGIDGLTVISTQ